MPQSKYYRDPRSHEEQMNEWRAQQIAQGQIAQNQLAPQVVPPPVVEQKRMGLMGQPDPIAAAMADRKERINAVGFHPQSMFNRLFN